MPNYPKAYGYAHASLKELADLADAGAGPALIAQTAAQRMEQAEARLCDIHPCGDAAEHGDWFCRSCKREAEKVPA